MGVTMGSEKRLPRGLRPPSTIPKCPSVFLWCASDVLGLGVRQSAHNVKHKSDLSVGRVRLWSSPVRFR